ncbi:low affinity immunoglobulin gamma Fc region receptor III-A-like [Cebidichthys violaceus]|uniref:low affinity immunoglobulin gamma Fc region receptor III-A-like n=1 Tax=Cebidichthys violaceus TaxID=271503 RepID=UPI0035CAC551
MEVTALCIRLSMTVLFLLCALDQKVGSVILRVVANRLQFFEYESLIVHCEGLNGEQLTCRTTGKLDSTGSSCIIQNVFPEDSGEYWCETGAVKSSNSVKINVTAGSVILESPVLPVAAGDAVTLRCRNKTTSSDITAHFYKDGLLIRNSSTGNITILSVSNSDEGLYKCRISDGEESAESWLTVRETSPTFSSPSSSSSAPWIVVTALLMVLLLAVGLFHFGKDYWHRALFYLSTLTLGLSSVEDQAVSVEANAADADKVTYAVVTKKRKKKDEDELALRPLYYTLGSGDTQHLVSVEANAADADKVTYAVVTKKRKKKDEDELALRPLYYTLGSGDTQHLEPSASTNPSSKENALYSTIP